MLDAYNAFICPTFDKSKCGARARLRKREFYCIVLYNYDIVTSTYIIARTRCVSCIGLANICRMGAFQVVLTRHRSSARRDTVKYQLLWENSHFEGKAEGQRPVGTRAGGQAVAVSAFQPAPVLIGFCLSVLRFYAEVRTLTLAFPQMRVTTAKDFVF